MQSRSIVALSNHFGVALTASEGVGFLVYEPGGFYRPHRDRAGPDATAGGNETVRRRVSVVIFLNGVSEAPGPFEYAGGRLTFYGLIDDPAWRDVGFPLDADPGLLVAFDSATLHEVTPVAAGRRLSAVMVLLIVCTAPPARGRRGAGFPSSW